MKKCKGCGSLLQNSDPKKIGYTKDINKDYCMRCFRLVHYGDNSSLSLEKIDNNKTLELYKNYKDSLFVLIVDSFDALNLLNDDLLDYYNNYKVLLVINKIDLLPRSIKDDKIDDLFTNIINKLSKRNIVDCLLTYKGDSSFNELFYETINNLKFKSLVFVGRVNAGKTTIINKLFLNNELTVSMYPGTTSDINIIYKDDLTFIDTPGLIDSNSFISLLSKKDVKSLIPTKCVKPRVFQIYNEQAYFVEGLASFIVKPKKNASICFYINNNLEIHRTKESNYEGYYTNHINEYKLKLLPFSEKVYKMSDSITYYIKGLGFIRIIGKSNVKINIHKSIEIYKLEVNL